MAFTAETIDATRTGDTYSSLTAPCAVAEYDPKLIADVMITQVLGNKDSVDPSALCKFITILMK